MEEEDDDFYSPNGAPDGTTQQPIHSATNGDARGDADVKEEEEVKMDLEEGEEEESEEESDSVRSALGLVDLCRPYLTTRRISTSS